MNESYSYVAFRGDRCLCRGDLGTLVPKLLEEKEPPGCDLRILREDSGKEVDLDWRGDAEQIVARAQAQLETRSVGRPKLGVRCKEVSLLPRQWAWLEGQRGSISANLRKIVDQHIRESEARSIQVDPLYYAMSALAGDRPGFEEASRSLFAGDWPAFRAALDPWPSELAGYLNTRLDELLSAASRDSGARG